MPLYPAGKSSWIAPCNLDKMMIKSEKKHWYERGSDNVKIYTGTGDKGKTSLFSGERLLKCDRRIEAYGELDELNSVIGCIKAAWEIDDPERARQIDRIQGWLLDAGAWLATTPGSPSASYLRPFTPEPAQKLESAMDAMSAEVPELKHFILPQGHLSAAKAHLARTVCRRVERRIIALAMEDEVERPLTEPLRNILVFLNRLSDYFFVLARYLNHRHGVKEPVWKGE